MAIQRRLLAHGATLQTLDIASIEQLSGLPSNPEQFDDPNTLQRFCGENPRAAALIESSDRIVVNGEGTLHGMSPGALRLLYLTYISKRFFDKPVHVINHSVFPDEQLQVSDRPALELYRQVYRQADVVAVREAASLDICRSMGIAATLAFDCLPMAVREHFPDLLDEPVQARLTIAGSAHLDSGFVQLLNELLQRPELSDGYQLDVMVGARARMAADDVRFVQSLAPFVGDRVNLVRCANETQWLQQIARSSLLISGRFHHSIAAASLGTPFLMFGSNTPKNQALLARFGDYPGNVVEAGEDHQVLLERLQQALRSPQIFNQHLPSLDQMADMAGLNFSGW